MNDPLSAMAGVAADKEKPPSRLSGGFKRFTRKLRAILRHKPEAAALYEAVDDLIEKSETSSGAPVAERVFLDNILSLRDKEVCDCMVPRGQIVALDIDSEFKELVNLMTQCAHSRIPVYRETLDDIVGMIHMKDVLDLLAKGQSRRIRELLRPVLFVAPSMPVSKLLLQMRQTRQHMAMVVDEFGGIDGIVTIEDLVEEIVGEIEDEHDLPATPQIIVRSDGTLIADALLPIEDFEARVGVMLSGQERETIDTLAGYVLHLAGHIPQIGETVSGANGVLFEVLETDQSRIKRVRVRGLKRSEEVKA